MSSGPGQSVKVGSVESLRGLKLALEKFGEEALAVVTGMDMETRRAWHWLDREMPAFWQGRIKRLEFEHAEAKNALFRKKLQAAGTDHAAYDTAEKELVRRLDKQLEQARAKLEMVRRWRPQLERALDEYNARVRGMRDQVEGGVERHMELLDRMVAAIESYSALHVPVTGPARGSETKPADEAEAAQQGEQQP